MLFGKGSLEVGTRFESDRETFHYKLSVVRFSAHHVCAIKKKKISKYLGKTSRLLARTEKIVCSHFSLAIIG